MKYWRGATGRPIDFRREQGAGVPLAAPPEAHLSRRGAVRSSQNSVTGEVPRTPLLVEVQITISLQFCKHSRAQVPRCASRGRCQKDRIGEILASFSGALPLAPGLRFVVVVIPLAAGIVAELLVLRGLSRTGKRR